MITKGVFMNNNSLLKKEGITNIKKLNRNGIKTYIHTPTKGYPTDINTIVQTQSIAPL